MHSIDPLGRSISLDFVFITANSRLLNAHTTRSGIRSPILIFDDSPCWRRRSRRRRVSWHSDHVCDPPFAFAQVHRNPLADEQRELTISEYEDVSDRDMDTLYESLEILCEDFGGGEWEVEYSVSRGNPLDD